MAENRKQIYERIEALRKENWRLKSESNEWNYNGAELEPFIEKSDNIEATKHKLENENKRIWDETAPKFLTKEQKYGGWLPVYMTHGKTERNNIKPEVLDALKKEIHIRNLKWITVEDIVKKMMKSECRKNQDYKDRLIRIGELEEMNANVLKKMEALRRDGMKQVRERNEPKIRELDRQIEDLWKEYNRLEEEARIERERKKEKPKDTRLNAHTFEITGMYGSDRGKVEEARQKVAENLLKKVKL
jgi:hypothetical protein